MRLNVTFPFFYWKVSKWSCEILTLNSEYQPTLQQITEFDGSVAVYDKGQGFESFQMQQGIGTHRSF